MTVVPHRSRSEPTCRTRMIPLVTRLFIAGHSDSGDGYLGPREVPWPERTRAWLEETSGEPVQLSSARFAAMGPGAADYLLRKVQEASPDIVVLPLGA